MLRDCLVFPILLATDLDAARAFYRDTLGLELVREDEDDRLVFRCGDDSQLAVTKSTTGTADTQTQLAWRVRDIHAVVADLRARGVRVEEYEAIIQETMQDTSWLRKWGIEFNIPVLAEVTHGPYWSE